LSYLVTQNIHVLLYCSVMTLVLVLIASRPILSIDACDQGNRVLCGLMKRFSLHRVKNFLRSCLVIFQFVSFILTL